MLRVEQTLVESTLDVDSRLDEEPSTGRARDPHRLHLGVGVTERLHGAEQAGTRADNRVIGYAGRAGQDHAARIADRPREAIGQICQRGGGHCRGCWDRRERVRQLI